MENYAEIPYDWPRDNKPKYFYTYFGDVYHGHLYSIFDYKEGFFIVPEHALHKLLQNNTTITVDLLKEYGWEINDYRVIKDISYDIVSGKKQPDRTTIPVQKRKRMFVFGAGASKFCCYGNDVEKLEKDSCCPPLGYSIFDETYDEICRKYPALKHTIPEFYASKSTDIEEYFEKEWQKFNSHYKPLIPVRHINTQYYLQELFQFISLQVREKYYRKNLYSLFANKLQSYCSEHEDEIPMIVSFNYDTILDYFLFNSFSQFVTTIDDYINYDNHNFVLLKPHGSCNWGWRLKHDYTMYGEDIHKLLFQKRLLPYDIYKSEIHAGSSWTINYPTVGAVNYEKKLGRYTIEKNNIDLINPNIVKNKTMVYYPALLLPYRDKDDFVMPEKHQNVLRYWVDSIEEITMIGWKAKEELFNLNLKNIRNLKRLIIVNPKPENVKENLKDYIDFSKIEVIEVSNFEDYIFKFMDKLNYQL